MEDMGEVILGAADGKRVTGGDPVSCESTEECTRETPPPRHEDQPGLGAGAEFVPIPWRFLHTERVSEPVLGSLPQAGSYGGE
jgi:hypothetical protein